VVIFSVLRTECSSLARSLYSGLCSCIDSFTRLTCPLCRSYFDPRAVRPLHIDVAPQTPDTRTTRVGHTDDKSPTSSKEDLKDRIISIVRNGADGGHYQALIQETCTWLKEHAPEEVSNLVPELDCR
jgi:hypothetical protein